MLIFSSPLLAMAFSRLVRKQIYERDGGKSVWSGETENLHAAHITHDKSHPRYNDPSNGRMLSRREHALDHINREGRNGLSRAQNRWAINMLFRWLSQDEKDQLPN